MHVGIVYLVPEGVRRDASSNLQDKDDEQQHSKLKHTSSHTLMTVYFRNILIIAILVNVSCEDCSNQLGPSWLFDTMCKGTNRRGP